MFDPSLYVKYSDSSSDLTTIWTFDSKSSSFSNRFWMASSIFSSIVSSIYLSICSIFISISVIWVDVRSICVICAITILLTRSISAFIGPIISFLVVFLFDFYFNSALCWLVNKIFKFSGFLSR